MGRNDPTGGLSRNHTTEQKKPATEDVRQPEMWHGGKLHGGSRPATAQQAEKSINQKEAQGSASEMGERCIFLVLVSLEYTSVKIHRTSLFNTLLNSTNGNTKGKNTKVE